MSEVRDFKKSIFWFFLTLGSRETLRQAWTTSGPQATYGQPCTLMWPYIWGFLNSYIDYENTLNIKEVPVLLQKQP